MKGRGMALTSLLSSSWKDDLIALTTAPYSIKLVQSYCMNMYGGALWSTYFEYEINKLRVAYNQMYRRILGYCSRDSASLMFAHHGIMDFNSFYRKQIYCFKTRLLCSDNYVLTAVSTGVLMWNTPTWRRWSKLLYVNRVWCFKLTDIYFCYVYIIVLCIYSFYLCIYGLKPEINISYLILSYLKILTVKSKW